jgi:hypothetical protein
MMLATFRPRVSATVRIYHEREQGTEQGIFG